MAESVTVKAERSRLLTEARDEIAILKARLAFYEQAVKGLAALRSDLTKIAPVKDYDALLVENAQLRETLRWMLAVPGYAMPSTLKDHVALFAEAPR